MARPSGPGGTQDGAKGGAGQGWLPITPRRRERRRGIGVCEW